MQSYIVDKKQSLKLIEQVEKKLLPNEVRVKILYSNVCGSDIKNYNNPRKLGVVLGHEASGVVLEAGDDVKTFLVNDRVCIFPMISCFECEACLSDNHRDCEDKLAVGLDIDGTFASTLIIDHRGLIKVDDRVTDIEAANVEALACSNRLVKDLILNKVDKASDILIIGDGPIAIGDVLLLKLYGFKNITLIGKYDYRIDIAKKLDIKAFHFSYLEEYIKNGNNIDVVVYAAFAADTLNLLFRCYNKKVVFSPQVRMPQEIEQKYIDLISISRAFAYKYSDFYDIQNFFIDGKIDNGIIVSNIIDFADLERFDDLIHQKSKYLKTVVKISQ
ncbi:MAG: alcohol dehydrogenase catalytic domain-containing protein [Campylobacterales bacterium]|nr:alcohol dehydrogenase catalytic domain-containing protein [Campylobacterales bacterium]